MISPCERLHLRVCTACDQTGSTVDVECPIRKVVYEARDMGREVSEMLRNGTVDHRLVQVVKQFCETVDDEVRNREHRQQNPGGQHVPHTGDFASAVPSVISRLRWWTRELRSALP